MEYFFRSLATRSFWNYALFSKAAFLRIFSAVGVVWTFMELLDFLGIFERSKYSALALFPILGAGVVYSIVRVRPVQRISYRVSGRDICIDVRIGDLLNASGEIVISTNTTFDTEMASGLISPQSLQGQFATRMFRGNTNAIDQQLQASLARQRGTNRDNAPGKNVEYEVGAIGRVATHGNNYYFLAMARLNDQGTAHSSTKMIEHALDSLWDNLANSGDFSTISVPLVGTGRGRVGVPRKKMIERIAQSFVDATKERQFSNHLVIYVHPIDAAKFELNLFEVKDYLAQSLHG